MTKAETCTESLVCNVRTHSITSLTG